MFSFFSAIMKQVVEKCVAGAKVLEICEFSDQLLLDGTSKVFKKEKEMKKGLYQILVCPFSSIETYYWSWPVQFVKISSFHLSSQMNKYLLRSQSLYLQIR